MLEKIRIFSKMHMVTLIICVMTVLAGSYFFLAQRASRHAAEIFNYFMAKQQVLIGSVTAQELRADIWGNVYFTNLTWDSPAHERLLSVPEGRIKIKPWDIVLRRAGLSTVEEIELHKAYIHLGFDDKMRLDVLQRGKRTEQREELNKVPLDKRHLQLNDKLPNIKLILQDTVLSAEYHKRHFILNAVRGTAQIRRHEQLELHLSAGRYGGSIAGEGLNIDGKADLSGAKQADINIALYEVIPDSLGLRNVKDALTVTGQLTGSLDAPLIDGALSMKELHLPNLYFTKINGNYHYENGLISFKDVTGSIYGGTLEARGLYHFDNHHYKIDVEAKNLMASTAAKSNKISTSVDLNIKFRNLGRHGNNLVYGSFTSGKGTFMMLPFRRLKGSFSDQNGELAFNNVEVETSLGTFESSVFKLVKGKLQLGSIFLVDDKGQRQRVR